MSLKAWKLYCIHQTVQVDVVRRAMQARLGALKREEEWLHKEQERLESDKVQHIRSAPKSWFGDQLLHLATKRFQPSWCCA